MSRGRRGRARVVGCAERGRSGGHTSFGPAEHVALLQRLLSKPDEVLCQFADLQIVCLAQLEGWEALRLEQPQATARVIFIAATLGIPEDRPEDLITALAEAAAAIEQIATEASGSEQILDRSEETHG